MCRTIAAGIRRPPSTSGERFAPAARTRANLCPPDCQIPGPPTQNAANQAKYGTWGSPYGYQQFLRVYNTGQIWAPKLAKYLGGDPSQAGNHYKIQACYVIQLNEPQLNPIQYAFWYGMVQYGGTVPPKLGRVQEKNLSTASYPSPIPAGYIPVPYLLSCGNLGGTNVSNDGIKTYWGFTNNWGNFGKVHGETKIYNTYGSNSGGSYMNIMGLHGGTARIDARPYPAVAH